MIAWRSFGASVIGPGHIASRLPNQDAWIAFHDVRADGIAVSDGLGSKPFSDLGSCAACRAVALAVRAASRASYADTDKAKLIDCIVNKWIALLSPLPPQDCAATCLFGVRIRDSILVGMLGDGLAAAIKTDGSIELLTDKKEHGFSNLTAALSPKTTAVVWQWLECGAEECHAIVLCTDGVADDLDDCTGFVKEFFAAHRNLASVSASRRTRKMLERWPTPKHSDDKTIACLCREEASYE
ncbi:PP2C family serine/threonine-protein phosphatase [Thermopirellula anaerolimosa]